MVRFIFQFKAVHLHIQNRLFLPGSPAFIPSADFNVWSFCFQFFCYFHQTAELFIELKRTIIHRSAFSYRQLTEFAIRLFHQLRHIDGVLPRYLFMYEYRHIQLKSSLLSSRPMFNYIISCLHLAQPLPAPNRVSLMNAYFTEDVPPRMRPVQAQILFTIPEPFLKTERIQIYLKQIWAYLLICWKLCSRIGFTSAYLTRLIQLLNNWFSGSRFPPYNRLPVQNQYIQFLSVRNSEFQNGQHLSN